MRELVIDGRRIADDAPCYVCAEIGGNHGGSEAVAAMLIREAAEAGADAVKFQRRHNQTLYTSALLAKPYGGEHSYGDTYGQHRAALELPLTTLARLQKVAAQEDVTWFATAFDERSMADLMDLHVPAIKIHSGGLTDERLIRCAAATGVPVLLSTGGGTLEDIQRAVDWLAGAPHAILHCTASYPLQACEANLRAIGTLRAQFPTTVIGWSSHYPGLSLSLVAYAFGARILEHHVTLSRAAKGTDHGFSLEPKGLRTLVEDLGTVQQALGTGQKVVYPSERAPLAKMTRTQTTEGWRIAG